MSDVATNEAPSAGDAPVKTAKQLEKEAKKAAKLAKLQEKLDKKAAVVDKEPKEVRTLLSYEKSICILSCDFLGV